MTDITKLLDGLNVSYEEHERVRKKISARVRKMIFKDKILQDSIWVVDQDFIKQNNFDLFGGYKLQRKIIAALNEFNELDIYAHDPWEGGRERVSTLTQKYWMYGETYPVIKFTSFAKKEHIKELVEAAGIVLDLKTLDDKVDTAKRNYDWHVKRKNKWVF